MKFLLNFFSSKINWLAIILILTQISDEIMKLDFSGMTPKEIASAIIALIIMVIRTYFVQKPISKAVEKRVTIE